MKESRHPYFTLVFLLFICFSIAFSVCQAEPLDSRGAAAVTGQYQNLFKAIGISDAEVSEKVNAVWQQLFYGDHKTQRIYYEVGPDMAYIKDVGNGDVRSEGIGYGLMICVQMNKKAEFDKIWNWARTYMYYSSGIFKGYFAWHCTQDGDKIGDVDQPAPDGEEYMATALIFAAKRWGNGTGIYDYVTEAQNLLNAMLHQSEDGLGFDMFDRTQNQVVFSPRRGDATLTDPSYHLPAFYEVWAQFLNAKADQERVLKIADTSRKFFAKTAHPSTGLSPDFANWDGTPRVGSDHQYFLNDAYRTVANAAVDYAWWQRNDFAPVYADRIQGFFHNQGIDSYLSNWTLDGAKPLCDYHSTGLVAMNAVASLAATNKTTREQFVKQLWETRTPTGRWRYYDGTLYLMALLHCSGNFKAHY